MNVRFASKRGLLDFRHIAHRIIIPYLQIWLVNILEIQALLTVQKFNISLMIFRSLRNVVHYTKHVHDAKENRADFPLVLDLHSPVDRMSPLAAQVLTVASRIH